MNDFFNSRTEEDPGFVAQSFVPAVDAGAYPAFEPKLYIKPAGPVPRADAVVADATYDADLQRHYDQVRAKDRKQTREREIRNLQIKKIAVKVFAGVVVLAVAFPVGKTVVSFTAQQFSQVTQGTSAEIIVEPSGLPESLPREMEDFISGADNMSQGEFSAAFHEYVSNSLNGGYQGADDFLKLADYLDVKPSLGDNIKNTKYTVSAKGIVTDPLVIAAKCKQEAYLNTTNSNHMRQFLINNLYQAIVDDYGLLEVQSDTFDPNTVYDGQNKGRYQDGKGQISRASFEYIFDQKLNNEEFYQIAQEMQKDAYAKYMSDRKINMQTPKSR